MKFDKEFLLKHLFWILLGSALVLWIPIFSISIFGFSNSVNQQLFESKKLDVSDLKDFKNANHVRALDVKEVELEKLKLSTWQKEWDRFRDPNNLYWNEGPEGPFWFKAGEDWRLDIRADEATKLLGPTGLITRIKECNMDGKIDPVICKKWIKEFYEPEIDELRALVHQPGSPADYKAIQIAQEEGVLYFKEKLAFGPNARDPTTEEVWMMQEDLAVRREILRLLHRSIDATLRFNPIGLCRKLPSIDSPHTYENTNWRIVLVGDGAAEPGSSGSGVATSSAPGSKARGSFARSSSARGHSVEQETTKQGFEFGLNSKLVNIRADRANASLRGLRLRFTQKTKEPLEISFPSTDATLKYDKNFAGKTLKDLGLKEPIVLKDFDADQPIQVSVVSEGIEESETDDNGSKHLRLRNAFWELDLIFVKQDEVWYVSDESKITNIHPGHRQLDMYDLHLSVEMEGKEVMPPIELKAEAPVNWNSSRKFKELDVKKGSLKVNRSLDRPDVERLERLLIVSQVPTWNASPVKRLDKIEIGIHSQMTSGIDLVARKKRASSSSAAAIAPAAHGESGSSHSFVAAQDPAANVRYEFRRYSKANDQQRLLPVAIVLIVDQAQMQDVLSAFEPANSRFQFMKTMPSWQHCQGIVSQSLEGTSSDSTKRSGGKFSGLIGGGSKSGSAAAVAQPGDYFDPNMVEIVIYGIVKLYEPPPGAIPQSSSGSSASSSR